MEGIKSAAILLLSMGEDNASEVLKYLDPRQVQKVGMAMTSLGNIPKFRMQEVLTGFLNDIEAETSLTVDSDNFIRTVLINALGEEQATPFIERILGSDKDTGLNRLRWLDARLIADVIRNEHPQIIATILIHLDSEQSAEVVGYFSPEKRAEVLLRMCTIDAVKPEAVDELGRVLEKQLSGLKNTSKSSASHGGIKTVADVINFLEETVEDEVLTKISEWDEALCEQIKDKMFVFDNIRDMDNRSLQTLLRDISTEQLKLALKGTTEEVKEHIFSNMSKRAADMLREELDLLGPVKLSDVEEARREIITTAKKMAEDGSISLGMKGGEEMV